MIQPKMKMLSLLFVMIMLAASIQPVKATTMNLTVPKGQEITRSLSLAVEDHVLIEFTVVGHAGSILDFYVADPHGNIKVEYKKTGNVNYCFVCNETGEYILHFSNTDTSEDKLVTLNFEIQHYIFGIPQMLFMTLIILLVCMGAVATFILMGKPR